MKTFSSMTKAELIHELELRQLPVQKRLCKQLLIDTLNAHDGFILLTRMA